MSYWPGVSRECKEVEGCKGPGSKEHISHVLSKMSITELTNRILSCCGDKLSPAMSCMCYKYAREIEKRGDYK